jgi:ketosteroid isomerase-like protein
VEDEMTGLTNDQARALLSEAFANLLDPSEDVETLGRYFSQACVQEVDGEVMDYGQFLDHARTIKRSIRAARVTFEALIVEGSTVADIHIVESERTDGARTRLKVIAFNTIDQGKIVRVDELTRVIRE